MCICVRACVCHAERQRVYFGATRIPPCNKFVTVVFVFIFSKDNASLERHQRRSTSMTAAFCFSRGSYSLSALLDISQRGSNLCRTSAFGLARVAVFRLPHRTPRGSYLGVNTK